MGGEYKVKITGDASEFAAEARLAAQEINRVEQARRSQEKADAQAAAIRKQIRALDRAEQQRAFNALPLEEQLTRLQAKRAEIARRAGSGLPKSERVKLAYELVGKDTDRQIRDVEGQIAATQIRASEKAAAERTKANEKAAAEQARADQDAEARRRRYLAYGAGDAAAKYKAQAAEEETQALARQERLQSRLNALSRELHQSARRQREEAFNALAPKRQIEALEAKRLRIAHQLERVGDNEHRRNALLLSQRQTESRLADARAKAPSLKEQGRQLFSGIAAQFTGATALLAIVGKLKNTTGELLSDAQRINDGKARLRVDAVTFQEFEAGAGKTGISNEDIAGSFKGLNLARTKALRGDASTVDAFDAFGVSIDDLKSKNVEQLFRQIGDRVSATSASSEELEQGMRLLGKTADRVLPAFREGFFEAGEQMRLTGNYLEDDVVDALERVGDRFEVIGRRMKFGLAEPVAGLGDYIATFATATTSLLAGVSTFWGTKFGGGSWADAANAREAVDQDFARADMAAQQKAKEEDPEKAAARQLAEERLALEKQLAEVMKEGEFQAMSGAQKRAALTKERKELEERINALKDDDLAGRIKLEKERNKISREIASLDRSESGNKSDPLKRDTSANDLVRVGAVDSNTRHLFSVQQRTHSLQEEANRRLSSVQRTLEQGIGVHLKDF